jgi:hypothetical protein
VHAAVGRSAVRLAEGGAMNTSEHTPVPGGSGASEDTAVPGASAATDNTAPAGAPGTSDTIALSAADGGAEGAPPAGKAPWRRPRPLSRPLWYPVAGGFTAVALLAGVAMTLSTLSRSTEARPVAGDCGLVTCGASLPPAVLGTAVPSTAARSTAPARRHHRHAHRQPALAPVVHQQPGPPLPGRHCRPHPGRSHHSAPPAVTVTSACQH